MSPLTLILEILISLVYSCTAQCAFNVTLIVQKKAIQKMISKRSICSEGGIIQVHVRRLHQQHEVSWCCRRSISVSGHILTLFPPPAVEERRKHFDLILNSHWFAPSCPFFCLSGLWNNAERCTVKQEQASGQTAQTKHRDLRGLMQTAEKKGKSSC